MRLCIYKEINRLRYILKVLFKKKEVFDFNNEDFLHYAPFHENGLFVKTETTKRIIDKYIKRNLFNGNLEFLSMLDIGCGTGELEVAISKSFNRVIGIDSGAGVIKRANARKIVNGKFLVSDADSLSFSNNSFDVVILMNSLHHCPIAMRTSIVKESLRVLKRGGLLIVFELNPFNPLQFIWFNFFSPIDRGMKMVSPAYLKQIVREEIKHDSFITIKQLLASLYFEYLLIASKN